MYEDDAITQSIENILSTIPGERVFLPLFGSPLPLLLFENMASIQSSVVIETIFNAIELWEDRITILRQNSSLVTQPENNTIILRIYYVRKGTSEISAFERSITL